MKFVVALFATMALAAAASAETPEEFYSKKNPPPQDPEIAVLKARIAELEATVAKLTVPVRDVKPLKPKLWTLPDEPNVDPVLTAAATACFGNSCQAPQASIQRSGPLRRLFGR